MAEKTDVCGGPVVEALSSLASEVVRLGGTYDAAKFEAAMRKAAQDYELDEVVSAFEAGDQVRMDFDPLGR